MRKRLISFFVILAFSSAILQGCSVKKSNDITDTAKILLKDAIKAYWIFKVEPLAHNDKLVKKDDKTYYEVTDKTFANLEEIKKYLGRIFSDKIKENLINSGMYITHNNRLYVLDKKGGTVLLWDDYSLLLKDESEYECLFELKVKKGFSDDSKSPLPYESKRLVLQKRGGTWKISELDFD